MISSPHLHHHPYLSRLWNRIHLLRILGAMGVGLTIAAAERVPPPAPRPQLLAKEVFLRPDQGRPAAAGFVSYVSGDQPWILHCFGREDYSDGYDDFAVQLSEDNGRSWTRPEIRWRSKTVPEGRMRYAEPAAFYDRDHDRLVVLIDYSLHPKDRLDDSSEYQLELNLYDPKQRRWSERRLLSFPGKRTPAMSFTFPIKTRTGSLLFPGMRPTKDAAGKTIHFQKTWAPVDESVTVRGRWTGPESLEFELGQPLGIDPTRSSRGLDENTVTQLMDGRIAAVCRGDNSAYPERPGYKWLSFSSDEGSTWSTPEPLPATGGNPIESGANGSALIRSEKNGKLYWLGNLALRGERAAGNWPRSPLCLVEVQENPFALKRESIFVVDERGFNDSPRVQMSNFRYYQDRPSGDLVIFLSRYGEQSEEHWQRANYYRYRVELPGPL